MTSILWWCANRVARTLPPDEATALLGDLVESRRDGWAALWDVLDLAARRHAHEWSHWRPWAAMMLVALPVGIVLAWLARRWALGNAVETWMYVDNWTWYHLASPGARRALLTAVGGQVLDVWTLLGCAWTTGYVLGHLSARTRWASASLLIVLVLASPWAPTSPAYAGSAVVFDSWIYRVAYPGVFRVAWVCIPTLAGLRAAAVRRTLSRRWIFAGGFVLVGLITRAVVDLWRSTSPILGAVGVVTIAVGMLMPMLYVVANTRPQGPRARSRTVS